MRRSDRLIIEKTAPYRDCFGWDGKECQATITTCALGDQCPFYKKMSDHIKSCEDAYKRISKLPEEKQTEIADKYYGGAMPWKDED